MLGPFTTASRLTPIHQVSPAVLSRAACASMSTTPTTTTTTTTTTRDRGDRYGPMEWAQLIASVCIMKTLQCYDQSPHNDACYTAGENWSLASVCTDNDVT